MSKREFRDSCHPLRWRQHVRNLICAFKGFFFFSLIPLKFVFVFFKKKRKMLITIYCPLAPWIHSLFFFFVYTTVSPLMITADFSIKKKRNFLRGYRDRVTLGATICPSHKSSLFKNKFNDALKKKYFLIVEEKFFF